ncbi:RNA polymerase II transcriptional coactivator [Thoreauomyces humboldtii]|nr:RNA polymerase II transcriptional coactivator [Thoreauomyces humboldtii]
MPPKRKPEAKEEDGVSATSTKKSKKPVSPSPEQYILSLDEKKKLTVSQFKGITLVGIREYYTDKDGEDQPGKKGIAISPAAWAVMKANFAQIDAAIKKHEA